MKRSLCTLGLCVLVFSSCEKARKIAAETKSRVAKNVDSLTGKAPARPAKVDPALQALVDVTPEGYLFRKDLPFPTKVSVKLKSTSKLKGRGFRSSMLEPDLGVLDGTVERTTEAMRRADEVEFKFGEETLIRTPKEGEDPKPAAPELPAGKESLVRFARKNGVWTFVNTGRMDSAIRASKMQADVPMHLIDAGVAPHPLWFGKNRLKVGDELTLRDHELAVIFSGSARGTATLRLEKIEPHAGHPCGVFSIRGDLDMDHAGALASDLGRMQVTIESGQVWLSLLHPLVLKEDLHLVVTSSEMAGASLVGRFQGTIHGVIEREWQAE